VVKTPPSPPTLSTILSIKSNIFSKEFNNPIKTSSLSKSLYIASAAAVTLSLAASQLSA
jgi:hypothetical protein